MMTDSLFGLQTARSVLSIRPSALRQRLEVDGAAVGRIERRVRPPTDGRVENPQRRQRLVRREPRATSHAYFSVVLSFFFGLCYSS